MNRTRTTRYEAIVPTGPSKLYYRYGISIIRYSCVAGFMDTSEQVAWIDAGEFTRDHLTNGDQAEDLDILAVENSYRIDWAHPVATGEGLVAITYPAIKISWGDRD